MVVVPFEPLTGGEGGQLLASGLTNGLIADLMLFDGMQVFAVCRPAKAAPSCHRRRPVPRPMSSPAASNGSLAGCGSPLA